MSGTLPQLTSAQLQRIAKAYRLNGLKILDVGSVAPWKRSLPESWVGVLDSRDAGGFPGDRAQVVTLAGSLPVSPQHCDAVLIRNASILQQLPPSNAESIIAAANLLSCLKPRGVMVAVMETSGQMAHWQTLLAGFPGSMQLRTLTGGLWALPVFAWLTHPAPAFHVFEFRLGRTAVSRLEWHRLARQRILGQNPLAPAA